MSKNHAMTPDERREAARLNCRLEAEMPTFDWEGYCLKFVRTMLDIEPPEGKSSARSALERTYWDDRHYASVPPEGVPYYFAIGKNWHIVLVERSGSTVGKTLVWSTDILRRGRVDLVSIDYIRRNWGAKPQCWVETLHGQRLVAPTAHPKSF